MPRGVSRGVVGVVVAPQAPDDLAPGAAEDTCGVGVTSASRAGAVVDVSRPRVWIDVPPLPARHLGVAALLQVSLSPSVNAGLLATR